MRPGPSDDLEGNRTVNCTNISSSLLGRITKGGFVSPFRLGAAVADQSTAVGVRSEFGLLTSDTASATSAPASNIISTNAFRDVATPPPVSGETGDGTGVTSASGGNDLTGTTAATVTGSSLTTPLPAVRSIDGVKRRQVQLLNRLQHEPGEVVFRQPIAEVGRHQVLLLTPTGQVTLAPEPAPLPDPSTRSGQTSGSPFKQLVRQPLLWQYLC